MLEQADGLGVDLEGILVLQEVEVEELRAHVAECLTNGCEMSHLLTTSVIVVVARPSSL
jgi:hypothetical protein